MPSKFKPALAGNEVEDQDQEGRPGHRHRRQEQGHQGAAFFASSPDKDRVLVEGAQMIKKHMKPNPQKNIAGGILEQEATIHISNVMLLDSEGNKTRVGYQIDGDNKKTRIARSNGVTIAEKRLSRQRSKQEFSSCSFSVVGESIRHPLRTNNREFGNPKT